MKNRFSIQKKSNKKRIWNFKSDAGWCDRRHFWGKLLWWKWTFKIADKADALSAKGIYKIEAKAGDYGTIEASSNLNVINNVSSNKTLEFDKSIIITTVEL